MTEPAQPAATPPTSTPAPEPATEAASLEPRPGTPSADPAVSRAAADVDATRAAFQTELARLQASGRAAFDVKARIRGIPGALASDPRKAAGAAVAGVGSILALRRLTGRGRRQPTGTLPIEVEEALAPLGKDGKKVRDALDSSFASYLETHGVEARRGSRFPRSLRLLAVPVATAVAREVLRRSASRRREAGPTEDD